MVPHTATVFAQVVESQFVSSFNRLEPITLATHDDRPPVGLRIPAEVGGALTLMSSASVM